MQIILIQNYYSLYIRFYIFMFIKFYNVKWFFAEKVSCRKYKICQIIECELCQIQNFSRILAIALDNCSEIFVTLPF